PSGSTVAASITHSAELGLERRAGVAEVAAAQLTVARRHAGECRRHRECEVTRRRAGVAVATRCGSDRADRRRCYETSFHVADPVGVDNMTHVEILTLTRATTLCPPGATRRVVTADVAMLCPSATPPSSRRCRACSRSRRSGDPGLD